MHTGIRATFSRADRLVAVSEEVADAVQLYTGIARERITTIPNGIDPDQFRFRENQYELRQKLSLPTNRPLVVSVGRLTQQKGYPHLLAALTLIPLEERPLTLIVGDGPDRNDLESKVIALKLDRDVRFLGNRPDVPALLAAADLFVLSSLWEGLPLALLEAMAARLPVVVTAVGGNSKVVENGVSGLLVPPADEHALTESLCRLLREPLQRQQMGQAAHKQFDHYYGLQRFIAAHESLYEEMLTERPQ